MSPTVYVNDNSQYSSFIFYLLISPLTNGCHFPDDIFRLIFVNENVLILIKASLKFVPKGPIDVGLDNSLAPNRRQAISKPMLTRFNHAYMRH